MNQFDSNGIQPALQATSQWRSDSYRTEILPLHLWQQGLHNLNVCRARTYLSFHAVKIEKVGRLLFEI